jgi:hypothetical protein
MFRRLSRPVTPNKPLAALSLFNAGWMAFFAVINAIMEYWWLAFLYSFGSIVWLYTAWRWNGGNAGFRRLFIAPNKHLAAICLILGGWSAVVAFFTSGLGTWWFAFVWAVLAFILLWAAWRFSRGRNIHPGVSAVPAQGPPDGMTDR